jgi:hypothetical protein
MIRINSLLREIQARHAPGAVVPVPEDEPDQESLDAVRALGIFGLGTLFAVAIASLFAH